MIIIKLLVSEIKLNKRLNEQVNEGCIQFVIDFIQSREFQVEPVDNIVVI